MSANVSPTGSQPTSTYDSAFLKACRREPVPHTPVWFMRQAGRSLPEYRKVREGIGMLDSCMRPDLVTEITLQPVRRHQVDAAIYFSDIVVPLKAIGIDLDIKPGVGPVVERPVRTRADLDRLRDLTPQDVPYVTEAIGMLTRELGATPLIGFAGALHPRQLPRRGRPVPHVRERQGDDVRRSRAVGGPAGPARGHHGRVPEGADRGGRLGRAALRLLGRRARPADYRRSVLPASAKVFDAVASYEVPRIHFGVGTGELLGLMGEAGADVVGVDWRVPLDEAARRVGPGKALQGNLDPTVLFAGREAVETRAQEVLDSAATWRATSSTSATASCRPRTRTP